jgi:hypothetical protein
MRRSAIGLNRFLAIVVGLGLHAVGPAVVGWNTGWLAELWPATPEKLSTACPAAARACWSCPAPARPDA